LAIKDGYNRAFITIVDANLTTFLTAIFLYVFGLGPIKGFAITLMVGIACSFFTAVWVTSVIVTWMTRKGEDSGVNFESGLSRNLLKNMDVKFMAKRKMAYSISGAIIAIGLVLMFTTGLTLGVDFQGGRSYGVQFSEAVSPTEIKIAVDEKLGSSEVKAYDTDNKVKITTPYLTEDESSEADEKVLNAVMAGLDKYQNLKPEVVSSSKVGATIADDIQGASQIAVIFSLVVLFLYILVRFRGWEFGLGAVAALFHDTLFVLSMFAIANAAGVAFEIDQVFVAAMLTIIGYSINDTVVVFDRVREFLTERGGRSVEDTFNASISSTLSRTVITSVTTLLVVLILFIFGGEVLRGFSFALLIGVLVGTYSSIFIATPVVLDVAGKRLAKKLEVQKPAVEPEEETKA
jgi:SecD/SecF fusion protein